MNHEHDVNYSYSSHYFTHAVEAIMGLEGILCLLLIGLLTSMCCTYQYSLINVGWEGQLII